VESKLRSGPSSLHLAAEAGHAKTAVELLEAGKKLGSSLTIQRKSAEDLSTELTFLAFLQGLL
jgi:ankyrin repeat protein